jgi:uncharacterized protein (DUF433 family)
VFKTGLFLQFVSETESPETPDPLKRPGEPPDCPQHVAVHQARDLGSKTAGAGVRVARLPVKLCPRLPVAKAFERITRNPDVLAGRATIRGLRISVAHVVNLVANGMTPAQIVEELPDLEEEDIREALVYAAALAQDELHPLRA